MKIKNSNNTLSIKVTAPIALIAIAFFSVFRSIQMAKFIDSNTGFFIGGDALNIIFYVLLILCCLFFVVVSFLSYEGKNVDFIGFKDKNAGIAAAVFAFSLIYDFFDSFVESASIFTELPFYAVEKIPDAVKLLMSTGALPYALQSAFALLSALYVILLAKSFLKGSSHAYKHKFIAVAPIAWAGFKMITRFVKQISYIKVSDLFLELMMLACMMLFFVALSQVVSGVYCDESRWRITAFGFSGGVIALCLNVPRFIFTFISKELVNAEYPFNIADAFFGIFAIFVALAAIKSAKAVTSRQ